ncbi:MAG: acyl carrier protein [Erysipelotrichales bacterium]|nr:acyl carrier protein [Erysipelotrichales bacterium]
MDTFELIQKYLSKIVRDPSTITPDATLRTLGVDSLDMVDMMVEIEEELGIRFKDEELVTMKTIGDAVSLINSKTGKESEGK